MSCPGIAKSINFDALQCGEYSGQAMTLHNLFVICLQHSDIFFDLIKNPKMFETFLKSGSLFGAEPYPEHTRSWALLLRDNEVPLNYAIFYSIIYNLELPWLPDFQQIYIKTCQRKASAIILEPSLDGNEKLQQTIIKLTEFFCSTFLTNYYKNFNKNLNI